MVQQGSGNELLLPCYAPPIAPYSHNITKDAKRAWSLRHLSPSRIQDSMDLFGRVPNAKQSSITRSSRQSADSQRIASDSINPFNSPRTAQENMPSPECLAVATSSHCTFGGYWLLLYLLSQLGQPFVSTSPSR